MHRRPGRVAARQVVPLQSLVKTLVHHRDQDPQGPVSAKPHLVSAKVLALRVVGGEGSQLGWGALVPRGRDEASVRIAGWRHPLGRQPGLPRPLREGADGRRHGADQPGEGGHHQLVPARPEADRLQTGAQGVGYGGSAAAEAHERRQKEKDL